MGIDWGLAASLVDPSNTSSIFIKLKTYRRTANMDQLLCLPSLDWPNASATGWNSTLDYYHYVCHYKAYNQFKDYMANLEQHTVFIVAIAGLVGGLGTVATLMQPLFLVSDFFLFRLIGYLETLQMALVALMNVVVYCNCDRSYICTFFWAHVATTASNVCADSVDLIVLFVCIERSVACLLPHLFRLIHTKTCYYAVAIWSLVAPTLFSAFQAFELRIEYDPVERRYADEPSAFASSALYRALVKLNTARFYATAFLIAAATVCSIIGFRTMTKRKRLLSERMQLRQLNTAPSRRKITSSKSISAASCTSMSIKRRRNLRVENARRLKKRQRDLCCLQLCLAMPIVINHILYAIGGTSNHSFVIGPEVFDRGMTYDMAVRELARARSFDYLRLATNLSNVLAHGLHFYLYVLFSIKVRHGFFALWKAGRRKLFRLGSSRKISVAIPLDRSY